MNIYKAPNLIISPKRKVYIMYQNEWYQTYTVTIQTYTGAIQTYTVAIQT